MNNPRPSQPQFAEIAVAGPLRRTFTYRRPDDLGPLAPGLRVLVPFGKARKVGYYLGAGTPPEDIAIKSILSTVDPFSYFPKDLFDLCVWMADYYFANPADCLASALPPALKSDATPRLAWSAASDGLPAPPALKATVRPGKRLTPGDLRRIKSSRTSLARLVQDGIITETWPDSERSRSPRLSGYRANQLDRWPSFFARARTTQRPFDGIRKRAELLAEGWTPHFITKAVREGLLEAVIEDDPAVLFDLLAPRIDLDRLTPTGPQQAVLDELRPAIDPAAAAFGVFLLHGVTGSGKTLVYCHLARDVIASGRTVLVLTPEIALTGTTLAYFRGFFGDRVTVLHSAMTDRERLLSFNGIRQGRYDIVIGPRSAVFAPLEKIGLVVVDEEHDGSYKQDDPAPRFNGRDCAIMRARNLNVPVLLGSASPSVESYYRAQSGKYRLLELTERPGGACLPQVRMVDMKTSRLGGDLPFLSWPLKKEVDLRLKADEQVILFLNRRGYSPQLKCAGCGEVPTCPNCQVKLTYHKVGHKLTCHYCGWMATRYDTCPRCQGRDFIYIGAGTQKIEETIPRLFEGAVAVRLDSDAAGGRRRIHDILTEFESGKSNLLLGTQMVTKGLDLPRVTLVGVLSADMMLDLPDFRASERTFSQLLQVAGRSGRADKPGEVLIQTYYPENEVIGLAAAQDYRSFYDIEIKSREGLQYPPFSRLVNFIIAGKNEKRVEVCSVEFAGELLKRVNSAGIQLNLLGPAPCPMYYLRGQYRRHLFVKTRQVQSLAGLLRLWEEQSPRFGLPSSVKIVVDVDPDSMM